MPLGQRPGDSGESRYCGVEVAFSDDIHRSLSANLAGGFDFMLAPLTDPSYRPSLVAPSPNAGAAVPPFAGSDLVLSPSQWSSHVVGKLSPWMDLDSRDPVVRQDSEQTLKQELSWASHLSLQACLMPTPRRLDCGNYAHCVNQVLQGLSSMQLWLRIPLVSPELEAVEGTEAEEVAFVARDAVSGRLLNDSWETWNAFRTMCEHHGQLSVALDIRESIPPPHALARWIGEPVKAAILHTSAFLTNKKGYPCLSKRHQALLATLLNHAVQIVVTGQPLHQAKSEDEAGSSGSSAAGADAGGAAGAPAAASGRGRANGEQGAGGSKGEAGAGLGGEGAGPSGPGAGSASEASGLEAAEDADSSAPGAPAAVLATDEEGNLLAPSKHPLRTYLEYLAYLYRKLEPLSEQERFEISYRDFLQAPLQPLMDNLEAQTYETFEKDATKYLQYRRAVHSALTERFQDRGTADDPVVLMVVGAGRGPLVRASLMAAGDAGKNLKVYAVEKNPNAVVTLHNLIAMEGWGDRVTVVSSDMRKWSAPQQADILVSELLGSFGDNELSPECLDGAQRFLRKDGISIPASYTSYIAPIAASKLHNDVKAYNDLAHFETAYVVKLHSATRLTDPQPVFTFTHPNRSEPIDNTRYTRLLFDFPPDTGSALVHGFGGYFDAVLYGDIHLGIEPATATPNMFSWFPIFFPLRQPMYVPAGAQLELHFWRCVGPTKVWYEWGVTAPSYSPVHNPNGRSYWVGL